MSDKVECPNCPLFGLRFGAQIELYYTVEVSDWPAPKKMWFPCVVKRLRLLADSRGTTVDGHVEFERSAYFPASTPHMVFIDGGLVRDDSGEEIPWRHASDGAEEQSIQASDEEGMSEGSGEDGDKEYQPEDVTPAEIRHVKKRKVSDVGPEFENGRTLARLTMEMDTMKRELEAQKSSLDLLRANTNGYVEQIPCTKPEPLLFAFNSLERFLLAAPTISGSERRRTAASMRQDVFTCTADCTLQSLDAVIHLARMVPGKPPSLYPEYGEILASIPDEVSIEFGTLQQLLALYGPLRQPSAKDVCVVNRYERGTSNAVLCRVIGCSAQRSDDASSPYLLAVGERLSSISANEQSERKVLFREACSWNVIENNFQHSLKSLSLTESELATHLQQLQTQQDSSVVGKQKVPGFSLSWRPCSDLGSSVFRYTTRNTILGTLTLQVPYVMVWGDTLLTELHHLLREFFRG